MRMLGGGTWDKWENILSWERAQTSQNLKRLGLCHVQDAKLEEKEEEEVYVRSLTARKYLGWGSLGLEPWKSHHHC